MKTPHRKVLDVLFPQYNDPAYQALGKLEELIGEFVARRSTAPLKQRLQRAVARLSEALVELADDEQRAGRETLLFRALLDCRKAANAVDLLYKDRVLDRATRNMAFDLLAQIAQLLIDRIHALQGVTPPMPLAKPVLDDARGETGSAEETSPPGGGTPPENGSAN